MIAFFLNSTEAERGGRRRPVPGQAAKAKIATAGKELELARMERDLRDVTDDQACASGRTWSRVPRTPTPIDAT